jgi:alkanesulfonate monooxygenase SsuD/methylene tetrahydromethanopterin reductase-like flavin-dependent oxidoreductase (luciferase family)
MPIADPWMVLGALAVRTERIRLGTAVTPQPQRRPQKLAREAVTTSPGGRKVQGVGAGGPPDAEYARSVSPTTRGPGRAPRRRPGGGGRLWSGERFSHRGRHFRADQVTFLPRPRQRPRRPVGVACTWPHRRPLRRAARRDGVVVARPTPDGGLDPSEPGQAAELAAGVRRHRGADRPFDLAVVNPVLPGEHAAAASTAVGATGTG